ncbi:MAG: CRISPR-associated helicase Cas3' [Candidatus Caldarchaeum sp.]
MKTGFYTRSRPLIEYVLNELEYGLNVVQLPTGYGKTAFPVVCGLASLLNTDNYLRSLHVLPLRSIIEDAHQTTLKNLKKLGFERAQNYVAAQMMGVAGSPFLNKKLVFVTFETFLLHLIKIPPAEMEKILCPSLYSRSSGWKTYGHFEIGRGAVFESFVFIDEPQLLIERKDLDSSYLLRFPSVLHGLTKLKIPVMLITATMSKKLREAARHAASESKIPYKEFVYGENLIDKDYENIVRNKKINTSIVKQPMADFVREKLKECRWNRVLIVVNTVENAKKVYSLIGSENTCLLHGRMTRRDRLQTLEKLRTERWLLVATQVVEAGVNLSAQLLITEAAPASSLVQRAGRVARRDEDDEGEIVIVKDDSFGPYSKDMVQSTVEKLEKALEEGSVEWRLPHADKGTGYSALVDSVHVDPLPPPNNLLVNQIINPLAVPSQASDFIEDDMVMVYVAADVNDLSAENHYTTELSRLVKRHPNARAIKMDDNGDVKIVDKTAKEYAYMSRPGLRLLCDSVYGFVIPEEDYLLDAYGVRA